MKKVLVFVLAIVMVMSMAIPAAADDTKAVSAEDLVSVLTVESSANFKIYSLEEALELLDEDGQKRMMEAEETLKDACPDSFVLELFFSMELLGAEDTVVFAPIEHSEIVFKQYIDGVWVERESEVNEDNTITCHGVMDGPFAVFANGVVSVPGSAGTAALPSPGASNADLIPGLSADMELIVKLHTPDDVVNLLEKSIQERMAEAKAELKTVCPEGFAVKYFFFVEIIGSEGPVSVSFEAIDHEEIGFKQYVLGEWVDLEFSIGEDGAITVDGVVEAPLAIFIK